MNRLGIDIGSKTIKGCLVDEQGEIIQAFYIRHRSKVKESLIEVVHRLALKTGDKQVQITVTGSAGMRVVELFDIPFVQEVVALKRAIERFEPDTDVVLEMGGEDTKLIYLSGVPEQRMNTICAGGTGGFIDTMAGMMGSRAEDMQRLAMGYKNIYPIASRCAVFAKSDVRPLLNAGASHSDVAASVLDAVCTQAIAGLSAGRPIEGKVLLLGGPFNYIPAMKESFCRVSGINRRDVRIPDNAHLFVVRGAAISPEKSEPIALRDFETQLSATDFVNEEGMGHLPPLFQNQEEYQAFTERHAACKLPRRNFAKASENLFVGIDAGSTTMKVALVDESGALVDYQYDWNQGDVMVSLSWMLEEVLKQATNKLGMKHTIRRSCVVGYGEDFCQVAFGVDEGEVETVAHLRAAQALEPNVDFLMDIGGQDIKCFYIEDGQIVDIVLNEACSSGCGSLFDSIARSLYKTKEGFAQEALFATSPIELGTRCSVFMDSRVKHAQKEGATHGDIAAGVAYATARNALFKVVRQPDFSKVGKHIVVQGGAFANDAILRAFELETKTEVIRPNLSQVMGAWGAALLARDHWMSLQDTDPKAAEQTVSGLLSLDQVRKLKTKKHSATCGLCTNNCTLMITQFLDQDTKDEEPRIYVTGNRCERGALAMGQKPKGSSAKRPPDFMAYKDALIGSYQRRFSNKAEGAQELDEDSQNDADQTPNAKPIAAQAAKRQGQNTPKPPLATTADSGATAAGSGTAVAGSGTAVGTTVSAATSDPAANNWPASKTAPIIGIPKTLAFYESFPFWSTFFAQLGFAVVSSGPSSDSLYRKGMGSIPSEGACYPAKLAHGHAVACVEQGAQALFAPRMSLSFAREGLLGYPMDSGLVECPLVERIGNIIEDNAKGTSVAEVPVLIPDLTKACNVQEAADPIAEALHHAGFAVSSQQIVAALTTAQEEYRSFFAKLAQKTEQILARIDAGEFPGAIVAGHPYHTDPGISHNINKLLGDLGYATIEQASCQPKTAKSAQKGHPWFQNSRVLEAIDALDEHPNLQLIVPRSFGCGIDAQVADLIHDLVRQENRIYAELKLDQIVDLAALRIRLRSLAYASRQRKGEISSHSTITQQEIDLQDAMAKADEAKLLHQAQEAASSSKSKKIKVADKKRLGTKGGIVVQDYHRILKDCTMRRFDEDGNAIYFYQPPSNHVPDATEITKIYEERGYRPAMVNTFEEYPIAFEAADGNVVAFADWQSAEEYLITGKPSAAMAHAPSCQSQKADAEDASFAAADGKPPARTQSQKDGTRVMMAMNGMQPVLVFGNRQVDLSDVKDAPGAADYLPPKRVHTSGKKIGLSLSGHYIPETLMDELKVSIIETPEDEPVPDEQAAIASMEAMGYMLIKNRRRATGAGRASVMDFSEMITFGNDDGNRVYFRDWESAEEWINTGASPGAMEMSEKLIPPPAIPDNPSNQPHSHPEQ